MSALAIGPQLKRSARTEFRVRLAENKDDLRAAQRLRYEVFNLELGEGLAESHATGFDEDPFDHFCDHLIVEELHTGKIVGTYRMQTGQLAAAHIGYYSEQEFDFSPFESVRCELLELGRACVHRDYRTASVLVLLWRGIALYATQREMRYLIGCSSLTSQDPALGIAMYRGLVKQGFEVGEQFRTAPLPAFVCEAPKVGQPSAPPKLLRTYLSLGARICGPPAIDREFGTLDFLTILDLQFLSPITRGYLKI